MMVPTAQLKVFVPLASFSPRERERWTAYVAAGRGLTRAEVAGAEAELAAARLVGGGSPLGPDAALVRRAGKRTLICPLQLDLRAAHALAAFRRTIPDVVVDQFDPDGAPDRPDDGPVIGPDDGPDDGPVIGPDHGPVIDAVSGIGAPHILDEPWAVPPHWFVAFAPDERHLHDPPEGRGPRVRHLTTVGQAVFRLGHAIEVVESTVADGDEVLLALAELAAWLDGFAHDAVVELDDGRVAALLPPEAVRQDRTCAELQEALDALASGDPLAAGAIYGAVRARWSHQHARHHAS
jgi:hypothetical protein